MKQEQIKEYYKRQLEEQKEMLAQRCNTLSKRMQYISEHIDTITINACGEVQSEGMQIDDICKKIRFLESTLDLME